MIFDNWEVKISRIDDIAIFPDFGPLRGGVSIRNTPVTNSIFNPYVFEKNPPAAGWRHFSFSESLFVFFRECCFY